MNTQTLSRSRSGVARIALVKGHTVAILAFPVLVAAACGGTASAETSESSAAAAAKRGHHAKVSALFPRNGANWNDYVTGNVSTATDTACNAASDTACLHGGERRVVVANGKKSCAGLTATDELGAFNWVCDVSKKRVQLVSTGLANGKSLSDLIDFTTKRFKPNKVTVKANGTAWIVTRRSVWWTNPIVKHNGGGSLAAVSTIYLVTSSQGAQYSLDADRVALLIRPGITLTGAGTNGNLISSTRHYLWLEGAINASGETAAIVLDSVRFSMLRNVEVGNTDIGILLQNNASNNTLSSVTANNNTSFGVLLVNASNNTLSDVTANSNTIYGFLLVNASNNTLSGVTANNNANIGVLLVETSNSNTLSGVTASNNADSGVTVAAASSNNKLSGVTASNNPVHGVLLADPSNNNTLSGVTVSNNGNGITVAAGSNSNTISGVTASNNTFGVFLVDTSINNTLLAVTANNNREFGVLITVTSSNNTLVGVAASNNNTGVALAAFSDNTTLSDVAASNSGTGIIVAESSNNRFTGLLRVGNNFGDCRVINPGTLPGVDDFTCANNGSSDATLTQGITLGGSFLGKVLSDDARNTSDIDGAAAFPSDAAVFDWTHFDNTYRGWGLDGPNFPDPSLHGRWSAGAGRIWDWSASSGDAGANGTASCTTEPCPALLGVLALPTGDDTLTHLWSGTPGIFNNDGCDAMVPGSTWNGSACLTTFLHNAVEITGGDGNDNALCESGETCLYTPNIGSYQGHGDLVSAGTFVNGALTDISLMRYAINGR